MRSHLTLPERLWSGAVADGTGCWVWQRTTSNGYGQLSVNGRLKRVHRLAYEIVKGPIPEGLELDHLCRNRACINPDHLEAVTMRENTLRGEGPTAVNARKAHCKRGHKFTERNIYYSTKGRECRTCRREVQIRRRHARHAAGLPRDGWLSEDLRARFHPDVLPRPAEPSESREAGR